MGERIKRWRFQTAPRPVRHALLKGKAGELYDMAHLAWRAGAISNFGYGRGYGISSGPCHWTVGAETYPDTAEGRDLVNQAIAHALMQRGIKSVAFGERWCGFRAAIVTYRTGARVVERYDGCQVVVETEEVAA